MTPKKALFPADLFDEKKRSLPYTRHIRVLLSSLSFVLYVVLYLTISEATGRAVPMLAVIPVIASARLYGLLPGIGTAVITLPMNQLLSKIQNISPSSNENLLIGTAGLIVVGIVIGRLRETSQKLKTEIMERSRVEEELKKHQSELDLMILEKTEEIQNTNEKLEYLIEASLDPIVISGETGEIVRINEAFLEMVAFSEEDVLGKALNDYIITMVGTYETTSGELVNIGPKLIEESKGSIFKLFETGKLHNWEVYIVNKEGRAIPSTVNTVLTYNKKGEISGSFGVLHDITDQRKSELNLIKAKEEAEAANHAKSAFLANMSHEIRTPMNGVIGFTDMLLNTALDSEQDDFAKTIKRSGEALLSLINDILDFSKIEAGKISIEEIDFDVEMLAYDVCEIIKPRLLSKDVEILCRIDDNLPATVKGDPHRFRQVLINLLGNAAKFTEKGEVELSLHVEHEFEDRILIVAKIRDTGIGIPEEQLEDIFDVFQQVDGSTTRKYGGSGLGLSISKKIAVLMGGDISVVSQAGEGSTFIFSSWVNKSEEKVSERLTPISLFGKKILITDDNQTNLDILHYIMNGVGMIVTACSNGEETIKTVVESFEKDDPFDICVFDIMMPGKSGYDVAREVREKYGSSIPLLAFSSSIDDSAQSCEEAGFNGFLPKPVNRTKLFKMMVRLIFQAGEPKEQNRPEAKILTQHSMQEDAKHSISILLAEDNPVNQKLIVKLLTKAGYHVQVANNGREAVDLFISEPEKYDIIIMDIQMPELNGLDATKMLREKGFKDIPIIAVTANALVGDRDKCIAAGMDDYISKPIKREVVFQMIKKWVIEKI